MQISLLFLTFDKQPKNDYFQVKNPCNLHQIGQPHVTPLSLTLCHCDEKFYVSEKLLSYLIRGQKDAFHVGKKKPMVKSEILNC